MFRFFKKPKLSSKMLVLVAIPSTTEQLETAIHDGGSDFIESLKRIYKTDDDAILVKNYAKTAKVMQMVFNNIRKKGAVIKESADYTEISQIQEYDIVVVIAHHAEASDHLEFRNRLVSTTKFVEAIPLGCKLIMDLTSCYSAKLLPYIKARIPESRIIGIDVATSLPLRMFLLDHIVDYLCKHPENDYYSALKHVLGEIPDAENYSLTESESSSVHLGGDMRSTVFAPKDVYRGSDFMVQLFLHHTDDNEEVELMARMIDEDATVRNTKKLRIPLQEGDKVDVELTSVGSGSQSDYIIDDTRKGGIWDGDMANVEFCVSVSADCKKTAFIGRIRIAVNKEPVGDMLFKSNIINQNERQISTTENCAPIEINPYDKQKEQEEATVSLLQLLEARIKTLKDDADINDERRTQDFKVCEKSLELIRKCAQTSTKRDPLRVFISSTSDMAPFRQVLRNQVESCEMYPDMYENWGQGNDYPRDKCCEHVLKSDIFVLLLGPKYGYVEPIWGLSMTEIEYRIALHSSKPMLIYLMKDANSNSSDLNLQSEESAKEQRRFINEVSTRRMIGIFSNDMALSLLSVTELLTIKHKILK